MAKKASKRPGRPLGARTEPRVEVVGLLAQCPNPHCQSTDLAGCTQTRVTPYCGQYEGRAYTHIVRRWKRCARCDQAVIEITYEYRGEG